MLRLVAEEVDQHGAEEERRERHPHHREHGQHAVGVPARLDRRQRADDDRRQQPDESRRRAPATAWPAAPPDLVEHVEALRVRVRLAGEDVLHRPDVLDVDRLVEAVLDADLVDLGLRRAAPGQPQAGIAVGDRLEQQERQHRDRRTSRSTIANTRRTTKRAISARCGPWPADPGRRAARRRRC